MSKGLCEDKLKELYGAIQKDIDQGEYYGASILVSRGGKTIKKAYFGDAAPGRQTQADDKYLLMSMSKAFTAVLILRAIDSGRFTLDTKVGDILPGFGIKGKEDATVRQLLNHTSGLPTALVPPPLPMTEMKDLQLRMDAINNLKAVYKPGTRCSYTSGTGYDVLGQILVATDPKKRSFNQIAKEDLFDLLGMVHTSFGLAKNDKHRVPVSFTAKWANPASFLHEHIFNDIIDENAEYPAGCAYSTLDDVFLFTEALAGRSANGVKLLSDELFDEARKNTTGDLLLEQISPSRLSLVKQIVKTLGFKKMKEIAKGRMQMIKDAKHSASTKQDQDNLNVQYPANFTLNIAVV